MVAVVTTSSPVVGAQSIVKSACPVPPAGTVTVRGFVPLTVQLDATLSATMWSAAASPGYVTFPVVPIPWGWPLSTMTV